MMKQQIQKYISSSLVVVFLGLYAIVGFSVILVTPHVVHAQCGGEPGQTPTENGCVPTGGGNTGTGNTGTGGGNTGGGGNPSNRTNTLNCPEGTQEVNYTCIPFADRITNCSSDNLSLRCIQTVGGAIKFVIRIGLIFAGVVAVIMMMVGGYQMLLSRGDPTGFKKGRSTVTQAIIGLLVVMLAYVIVQFITNLTNSNGLGF